MKHPPGGKTRKSLYGNTVRKAPIVRVSFFFRNPRISSRSLTGKTWKDPRCRYPNRTLLLPQVCDHWNIDFSTAASSPQYATCWDRKH
jgi:hypothetical protein